MTGPVLEIIGVSKRFGANLANDDISMNISGTLLEGIALWGELRPIVTKEELVDRALRYCDLAVTQGLLFIRSHEFGLKQHRYTL